MRLVELEQTENFWLLLLLGLGIELELFKKAIEPNRLLQIVIFLLNKLTNLSSFLKKLDQVIIIKLGWVK